MTKNEELLAQDDLLWTTEGRKRILALMDRAAAVERERVAVGLMDEADHLPCQEDGEVYRSAAWLVRGDFSYEEAERLETAVESALAAL